MKPCRGNRKQIAWLAVGALDGEKAANLREHIHHCEGCREYWEEVSTVAKRLESAAPNSELEPSEAFYKSLTRKLWNAQPLSVVENLHSWLRALNLNWRVVLPAESLVLLFGATLWLSHYPGPVSQVSGPRPFARPVTAAADLAPTILNYQAMAHRSLQQVDELLTQQANLPLASTPVYTASGVELASASL